jgi:cell division cycle 2-like protein
MELWSKPVVDAIDRPKLNISAHDDEAHPLAQPNSTTTPHPNLNMSSKTKSRWADDEEDAALEARRKQEKEEKKRLKAEKQRKAEEAAHLAKQQSQATTTETELSSRPAKRRKLTPPPQEPVQELPPAKLLRFPAPAWKKCRSVEDYEKLNDIEEGAYGWVSRARDTVTGKVVALKRLKMENANDGVPVTGLREIQTLMDCEHPNIVALREVVVGEDTSKIEK